MRCEEPHPYRGYPVNNSSRPEGRYNISVNGLQHFEYLAILYPDGLDTNLRCKRTTVGINNPHLPAKALREKADGP